MELRALRVVNRIPLKMLLMVLRKALNIVTVEIDSAEDMTDIDFIHLMQTNRMLRMQQMAVMQSKWENLYNLKKTLLLIFRKLSLQVIHSLLESCPHFQRVRYPRIFYLFAMSTFSMI